MNIRSGFGGVFSALLTACACCAVDNANAASAVRVSSGDAEVVISSAALKSSSAVRFAAEEMTNFLSRVFGAPVPIVNAPRAGKTSIILGTNEWSEAAGVAVADLPRDASVLSVLPNRIFIAGRDDAKFVPFKGEYDKEMGTLYGVYAFLERYAGCRFYFPGELGEITPRQTSFDVPSGERTEAPDWKIRRISHRLRNWFVPLDSAAALKNDRLFRYRMRVQTEGIPCCHGLELMNYSLRFGKTNPEYFRLHKGKRENVWKPNLPQYRHSMLCYTSDIWEEVYKDALSYFRGEGPEVRGITFGSRNSKGPRCRWGWNVSAGKYFDAMPQDGMKKCECPKCQEAYAKAKNPADWANEIVWGQTVRLANRLKAAGVDGKITQMAYTAYRDVPDIDIPDNVLVMVCSNGSWVRPDRLEKDISMYKAWYAKRNGNIWIWNNTGKHGCLNLSIPDLPCVTPNAFGRFYKRVAPLVFGAFCDNSADRFMYSALNYYVFCRVAWDNETDVDKLLDEYYRYMFGAAEKPMRQVFEMIERKWMNEVLGNAVETPLGTAISSPSRFKVWTKIYSQDEVRRMKELFASAAFSVPVDSLEHRRIAMMRREFLDPIIRRTAMYAPEAAGREEARRAAAGDAAVIRAVPEVEFKITDAMRDKEVYDRRFPLDLKPGKTYRVSYFLTCDDVRPYPIPAEFKGNFIRLWGGVQCAVQMARAPKSTIGGIGSGVEGSFARMLQEFEMTVPEKFPEGASPQLVMRMYNRTGTARFEDVRVEEVNTAAVTRVASGETEVVVSSAAMKSLPAVRFAAEEMTNFLSRVFGAPVPLVTAPRAGRTSIVLGTNEWSEAAGVAVADLPRDASVLSVLPNRIFIAGRDDPKFVPLRGEYDKEMGTLYGVYSFLERYAGCRFYFPGELGEITPRRNSFEVPTGALTDSPDWKIRRIPHRLGAWFEPLTSAAAFKNDRLFRYRMRVQTEGIPCCHGLGHMNYSLRFGKSNPEYFQLLRGKRTNVWEPGKPQYYHSMLCHTSGIWDEIYKDALSYFRGEGPEVRGMTCGARKPRCVWGWNVSAGKYFDAMPQDGMSKCECPKCQEAYAKAKNPRDWANELIWGQTVRLANRLKEAGIDGKITQMAYNPYRDVPEIDIPENVLVMVCSNGSWVRPERLEEDIAVYKAWYAKRNGNIWVWNNCGKHRCFDLDITDLPSVTPKSFGEFYRRIGPIVFGAYCSNYSERFLYSALNFYVFSHIAWDNDTDVDTLLDEYYRNMFGAAEKPMRQVFEMIERKWMEEVLGHAIETPIGTKTTAPTEFAVWTKIYTAEDVDKMAGMFASAASAVPAGSLEARRVALMKREFLDPIVRRTAMYLPGAAEREESRRAAAGDARVLLSVPEVKFEVTEAMRDKEVYDRRFPLDVKPGKTYRVSYFLTCDDVRPYPLNPKASNFLRRSGGVQCVVQMARAPKSSVGGIGSGVEGSFKRTLQEYEVTIPEKFPENASPQLVVRMYKRTGSAHFGSIRVEEVVK